MNDQDFNHAAEFSQAKESSPLAELNLKEGDHVGGGKYLQPINEDFFPFGPPYEGPRRNFG